MGDGEQAVVESENFRLCDMFGDNSRFVEFRNLTGRHIRLSGRLELETLAHMSWTTSVIVNPGDCYVWRFLAGSPGQDDVSLLSLLPEPYHLALENIFSWSAEYVDSSDEDGVTFNNIPGPLQLQSLPSLSANQRFSITMRRKLSPVPSLRRLSADCLVIKHLSKSSSDIVETLNIPRMLKKELFLLLESYNEMQLKRIQKCDKCSEIHHHL
eukprot:TRINITY_DN23723_c0_g1_i1.p1 TRINITY_DN23723_c0_g1~~TRINITY_DN23723_c0_g1_i1.p1  ORF type:complete len:212 (+),score=17.22 TRINITY_DN23723_c0_g1_i1:87-722(+)